MPSPLTAIVDSATTATQMWNEMPGNTTSKAWAVNTQISRGMKKYLSMGTHPVMKPREAVSTDLSETHHGGCNHDRFGFMCCSHKTSVHLTNVTQEIHIAI